MNNLLEECYLLVESGGDSCRVAVLEVALGNFAQPNITLIEFVPEFGLAEEIGGRVVKIIADNNFAFGDIKAIICSSGPGSFTGLRTCLAFSQGLAFAQNIPILLCSNFLAAGVYEIEK